MGEIHKWIERRGGTIKVDKEILNIKFEPKKVKCNETLHVFRDAKEAAETYGISYMRMKRHLEGEVPFLRCHNKLTFSYIDKEEEQQEK